MGPGNDGSKNILVLRDYHSAYTWLFAFDGAAGLYAAQAVIDWCAAFGVPKGLMYDGPTHFKNVTIEAVTKGLKVQHHFTLPYFPWKNGGIERLGKEIVRIFRTTLSELQLSQEDWPDLLTLVQSVINNSPSPQRGNVCPITAFTGHESTPTIKTFIQSISMKAINSDDIHLERLSNITKLLEQHEFSRRGVQKELEENRSRIRKIMSRGRLPSFTEGHFVLVARSEFSKGEKLCLRWRGSRRVTKAISDYVFQVEDLRNGQLEEVHISRLQFYTDKELNRKVMLSHILSSETGMSV